MRRVAAYLVHAYTATGAVWGLLSLFAILANDYRRALFWLVVATFVDATDGMLARLARVDRYAPLISGARLDDIIDYVNYVVVPGILLLHAERLPAGWVGIAVVAAMLLASAMGFSRQDAKTPDHYFTGFPSYWNIVALYVLVADVPPAVNAVVLTILSVMVFVPIRYVYPSRTPTLRALTVTACAIWGVQVALLIWWMPDVPAWLFWSSLAFPAYYTVLSLWLSVHRARAEEIT
jgi:phosphatidylcholine synthase